MKGLTIRQIFKAVNEYNNLLEAVNDNNGNNKKQVFIYLDNKKIYSGCNFEVFKSIAESEFIKALSDEIYNAIFCGCEVATLSVNAWGKTYEYKLEVYIATY